MERLSRESFGSARNFSREEMFPGAASLVHQEDQRGVLIAEANADYAEESDYEETSLLPSCVHRSADEDERPSRCTRVARRITRNETFQMIMAGLIVANTMIMAIQVDHEGVSCNLFGEQVEVWIIVNYFFLTCFVTEICLRLIADGCIGYFCHPHDWGWNLFDFVVIFFGVSDQLIAKLLRRGVKGSSNAVMAARMLRILRVLRVLRIFRAFKKLRMLARGLVESVEVVFWIMVLVLVMLFICAILTTTLIGQNVDAFPADEQSDIRMYWGSVARSMFTLFQFLTMDGWGEVDEQVVRQMPWLQLFFFPFIFFGAFVIMSLLTGVMADHMNDVRRNEETEEHRQRLTAMEAAVEEIKKRDLNNDGFLDPSEFEELFDEQISSLAVDIQALGLKVGRAEAKELFDWFDVDGNGFVDHEELRHGLKHLFEGLTPLQLFKLNSSVRAAERFVVQNAGSASAPWSQGKPPPSAAADELLTGLGARSKQLEERLHQFELQTRGFMEKFGWKDGKRMRSGSPRSSR